MPPDTIPGTYTIKGIRAHANFSDHNVDFVRVSSPLVVSSAVPRSGMFVAAGRMMEARHAHGYGEPIMRKYAMHSLAAVVFLAGCGSPAGRPI